MTIGEAKEFIEPFFYKKEHEILDEFATLSEQSILVKPENPDHSFVFIPGTRKDRVLLVAHVDTIPKDSPKIQVGYGGDDYPIFYSKCRINGLDEDNDPVFDGLPIGADDRAGVAALWKLKDLGHSLILTAGEEQGCYASRYLMSSKRMREIIANHQFALQFDRKGNNDLVFYNVGTKRFINFMERETKYTTAHGSFTDICVLCKEICGCNISIGFQLEHTPNEILSVEDWLRTVETAEKLLSKKDIPRFTHD